MADDIPEEVYESLQSNSPSFSDFHTLKKQLPTQQQVDTTLRDTAENVESFADKTVEQTADSISHIKDTVSESIPHTEELLGSAHTILEGVSTGVERGSMDVDIQTNNTISVDPNTLDTADRLTDLAGNVTDPSYVGNLTETSVDRLIEALADKTGIYTRSDILNLTKESAEHAAYAGGYSGAEGVMNAVLEKMYDLKEEAAIFLLSSVVLWKGYRGRRESYRRAVKDRQALSDAYDEFSSQKQIYEGIRSAVGGNTVVEALLRDPAVFNAQFVAYEPYPSRWKRLAYSHEKGESIRQHTRLLARVAEGISYFNENILKDSKANLPIQVDVVPSK